MNEFAIVFTSVNKVEFVPIIVRAPGPGEIAVRVEASIVSPGTEYRCLAGTQPGAPPFPFIPGYAAAGIVVEKGEGVEIDLGDRVMIGGSRDASLARCWGGHVSKSIVDAVSAIPIPDGIGFAEAGLVKLAAIAYRGLFVSNVQPGDRVAVVGLGPIGLLAMRWFELAGAEVFGVDLSPERVAIAQKSGTAKTLEKDIRSTVRSQFPLGADIVVDSTGNAKVLPLSMAALRDKSWTDSDREGPKLIIQGSYPGDFQLPYQDAFRLELTILMPRDAQTKDLRHAMNEIASGKLFIDDLITSRLPADSAAAFYDRAVGDPKELTAAFLWR